MICPKCGEPNDRKRYCRRCGARLSRLVGAPGVLLGVFVFILPGAVLGACSSSGLSDPSQRQYWGTELFHTAYGVGLTFIAIGVFLVLWSWWEGRK